MQACGEGTGQPSERAVAAAAAARRQLCPGPSAFGLGALLTARYDDELARHSAAEDWAVQLPLFGGCQPQHQQDAQQHSPV